MLKSRAFFSQAVTNDASTMKRFAWSVIAKAGQAAEGFFGRSSRPPKAAFEALTRSDIPLTVVPSRGLIAGIHRSSRGFVGRFLANNQKSDLVSAMRNRYAFGGNFRGLVGQRVAMFGFVGIGVAAGAQWPREVDADAGQVEMFSIVKQVHDMFGSFAVGKAAPYNSPDVLPEEEIRSTVSELGPSFVLLEDSSFSSHEPSISGDSDFSILSEVGVDEEQNDNEHDVTFDIDVSRSLRIDSAQARLLEEFSMVLESAEAQSLELGALRHSVLQLNQVLHQLSGETIAAADVDSYEPFEEFTTGDVVSVASGADDGHLMMRSVSLVMQQKRELESLREAVALQNKRLLELLEYDHGGGRKIAVRTSHCNRDACCGPGFEKRV